MRETRLGAISAAADADTESIMKRKWELTRRNFLSKAALAASAPVFAPLLKACSTQEATTLTTPEPPQVLRTEVARAADGSFVRSFHGKAAPQNLEMFDAWSGTGGRLHEFFPRDNCPFAIDTARELGPGGYDLTVVDRTLAGQIPTASDDLWALNMVPFGVAIDGVILDPSGPWYDAGPADPQNPFDRACSGWEYDPIFPVVAGLVGVPSDVRGHVQPGPGGGPGSAGLFHYHGTPRVMLANLRQALSDSQRRSPLVVGYAADGFWIVDGVVPAEATTDGKRLHLFSGYVLRTGERSVVPHTNPELVPEGTPDGTYVQDFVYDPERKRALIETALREDGRYHELLAADVEAGRAEAEVLDERNGLATERFTLRDAPSRTYIYVLTPDWPEVPRWFAFMPAESFRNNIIPLASPDGSGPPGRQQLYAACGPELSEVHQWNERPPY